MIPSIHIPRRFVTRSWGGTETVVLESVRQLNSLGHRARVFTSTALSQEPGLTQTEKVNDVTVHRFPYFYPYFGLSQEQRQGLDHCGGNLFSWHLLGALARERQARIIHLHTGKRMGGIARTAARWKRIPYVLSLHGGLLCRPSSESSRQRQKSDGALEWGKALGLAVGSRRVLQDAAAVLCLTRAEQSALQQRYPRVRCRVLPNGVDLNRFSQGDGEGFRRQHELPTDRPLLSVIGRIDPQKGQLTAVQAMSELPEAHLLLVGHQTDASFVTRIHQEIEARGLQQQVTVLAGLSGQELVDAYHATDLLLIPSTHEPFGIVALEGWASGTPVLASKVGGLSEIVKPETGVLLDRLTPGSLASEVTKLLRQKDFLHRLAVQGRREVARYSWAVHANQLLEIYREVLSENLVRQ